MSNFKEDLLNVKAFAFDVDGVFSGNILLSSSGEQLRPMNMKDGYAVQFAVKKGFTIAIISGGTCESIKKRFSNLGVKDIYIASSDKMKDYEAFLNKNNLSSADVLYMGDDLPDYYVMKKVGVPTCPADAASDIKAISKYISNIKGGEGCVRDVIEQVLRAQGKWMDTDAFHW
ncbi:MAG: 3-deoxy-D-manno-octulosonate 8-phosphate phosphatase [Bacteroidetes bacterium RIFOXYA12_FULL_35_11]|nr:MAG: 3-deoxy-D-manno-octulosonate 8-phosphate phosphatase [Bacteroidetes bacterium GWF2_35_48]OFY81005.1 MAG: 3-deoxy-D-manno-octulosonate 8-phosphate phosphatase [Bacteroidetes bacterium RIFOXYA12_FULL_35_11]OFY94183.1 MAG: 3-deoxy-D-manno-octulosonate 8-phosphate phosphatase [Bacteroidetes bacterium RIFOXYC12_FULL_35_7]HBX49972.1 3-deoxy-D-manno-octulosonate 8-phosphate phosphatase [Bacteroidales bacterium]